jgi:hypothetical protein
MIKYINRNDMHVFGDVKYEVESKTTKKLTILLEIVLLGYF